VRFVVSPTFIVAVVGVTVTRATAVVTVSDAVADVPPLLTVMTLLPAAEPVADTVAPDVALKAPTDAFDVVQANVMPLRTLFDASKAWAVKLADAPGAIEALEGVTATRATAAVTASVAVADFPPLLTATTLLPAAEPVTDTVAPEVALKVPTAALEEVHANVTPLRSLFDASNACAVKFVDAPAVIDAVEGVMATRATAAVTVSEAVAD
jgi:hypothetical protein